MAQSTQDRALEFAHKCELAGHVVRRIVVDGKRFEVEFDGETKPLTPEYLETGLKQRVSHARDGGQSENEA